MFSGAKKSRRKSLQEKIEEIFHVESDVLIPLPKIPSLRAYSAGTSSNYDSITGPIVDDSPGSIRTSLNHDSFRAYIANDSPVYNGNDELRTSTNMTNHGSSSIYSNQTSSDLNVNDKEDHPFLLDSHFSVDVPDNETKTQLKKKGSILDIDTTLSSSSKSLITKNTLLPSVNYNLTDDELKNEPSIPNHIDHHIQKTFLKRPSDIDEWDLIYSSSSKQLAQAERCGLTSICENSNHSYHRDGNDENGLGQIKLSNQQDNLADKEIIKSDKKQLQEINLKEQKKTPSLKQAIELTISSLSVLADTIQSGSMNEIRNDEHKHVNDDSSKIKSFHHDGKLLSEAIFDLQILHLITYFNSVLEIYDKRSSSSSSKTDGFLTQSVNLVEASLNRFIQHVLKEKDFEEGFRQFNATKNILVDQIYKDKGVNFLDTNGIKSQTYFKSRTSQYNSIYDIPFDIRALSVLKPPLNGMALYHFYQDYNHLKSKTRSEERRIVIHVRDIYKGKVDHHEILKSTANHLRSFHDSSADVLLKAKILDIVVAPNSQLDFFLIEFNNPDESLKVKEAITKHIRHINKNNLEPYEYVQSFSLSRPNEIRNVIRNMKIAWKELMQKLHTPDSYKTNFTSSVQLGVPFINMSDKSREKRCLSFAKIIKEELIMKAIYHKFYLAPKLKILICTIREQNGEPQTFATWATMDEANTFLTKTNEDIDAK